MSQRDELLEIIGRMCLLSTELARLSDDINDCWCEDHAMELTDKQREIAQKVEDWAQRCSHEASEYLKALRP